MATQLLAAVARRQGRDPGDRIEVEQFLPSEAGIARATRDVGTLERRPAREVG